MNDYWMAITIIFIIFGSLTAISIMWFFLALKRSNYRHEEVMSFIEKGEFDPTIMGYDIKYRGHKYFLWGGILFAIGVSILSFCLIIAMPFRIPAAIVVIIIAGIMPIIVGLGFLLYYFILRRKEKSEESPSSDAS